MRRLSMALLAVLPGCQLVVGDIELPTLITADAGWADVGSPDAELDAGSDPVDAAPDLAVDMRSDMWPDMAPDLAVDMAPDMAPDMNPDMGPAYQPPDLTALAGVWHLYGTRGTRANLIVFTAALRISEAGEATLTEIGSLEPLGGVGTLFDPHPDGSPRVSIHLFPRAGRLVGMMDPVSGAAVFANDASQNEMVPTFVIGSRVSGADALVPPLVYLELNVEPQADGGEGGTLRRMDANYAQRERLRFGAAGMTSRPDDRGLTPRLTENERLVLSPMWGEGEPQVGYALTPLAGGQGATGVAGTPDDPQRLALLWPGATTDTFEPADYWCALNALDENGEQRTHSAYLALDADGHMRWDDGTEATAALNGDLLRLTSARNLFGAPGGYASIDPAQRGVMLVNYNDDVFRWGMGLCLNLRVPAL